MTFPNPAAATALAMKSAALDKNGPVILAMLVRARQRSSAAKALARVSGEATVFGYGKARARSDAVQRIWTKPSIEELASISPATQTEARTLRAWDAQKTIAVGGTTIEIQDR
jgi:hypothetical protein